MKLKTTTKTTGYVVYREARIRINLIDNDGKRWRGTLIIEYTRSTSTRRSKTVGHVESIRCGDDFNENPGDDWPLEIAVILDRYIPDSVKLVAEQWDALNQAIVAEMRKRGVE